jgi:hypothetical protein
MAKVASLLVVFLLIFGGLAVSAEDLEVPFGSIKPSCYGKIDVSSTEFPLSEVGKDCVVEEWLEENLNEGDVTGKGEEKMSTEKLNKIDFEEYRWNNRPLFVFSSTPDREDYQKQLRDLSSKEGGIEDRDMIVHLVLEEGNSFVGDLPLENEAVRQLQEKFEIDPAGFVVILVGKDGGVKLRKEEYTPMSDIFDLIDSMPMRRQEMKEKGEEKEGAD